MKRKILVWAAAAMAAGILTAIWSPSAEKTVAVVKAAKRAAKGENFSLDWPRRRAASSPADVFAPMSWYIPPPPTIPKSAPKPEPTAPPLPFVFLGQYLDRNPGIVILAKGDRVYTVSEGDEIEGTYRVGKQEAGRLELTYLPLGIKQMLNLEGKQ